MLTSTPTKNGTGISIYGNYDELYFLYVTVHKIADVLDENNVHEQGQHMLLMNFAYEIRKATDHSRLIKEIDVVKGNKIILLGFQIVWTDMIIFLNVLRRNAGFISLDKKELLFLDKLEELTSTATIEYDKKGAKNLEEVLQSGVYIGHKYIFQIYQTIHTEFISATKGKRRFRNISDFLWNYLSPHSYDYLDLISSLEFNAKRHNCNIFDLEIGDFPEIIW